MELKEMKAIVEGLLFASGEEGATIKQLAQVLDITEETALHIIEELTYEYEHTERGIRMMKSGDSYLLTTKPEHNDFYKKFLATPQASRLSQAALETLAIIAYRQPITRIEIDEIRGVKSDRPIQTLLARMLIEEVGRKDTVGRPILFGTTKDFLVYFGLTSLEELPPLPEEIPDEEIEREADLYLKQFND